MRDIKKVEWYYLDMRELDKITEEVYGVAYDIQAGEYPNGSYVTADTSGQWEDREDDWEFPAMKTWMEWKPEKSWDRYEGAKPTIHYVLRKLAERGEIPHGTYFISIDW